MDPYAIFETGGKQYRVRNKEIVTVEKLESDAGSNVSFDRVLAVSNGQKLLVGAPTIDGATITGTVMEHLRGPKLISFKYKKRKGYRRKQGHRQSLTRVKIHTFIADEEAASEAPAEGDESDGS